MMCLFLITLIINVCRIEEAVMKSQEVGQVDLCVQSRVIEMKDGFVGHNVTLPVSSTLFFFTHL